MVGNVWQWMSDQWIDPKPGADGQDEDLVADYRIIRGGSFLESRSDITCAARDRKAVDTKRNNIGFRIVCTIRDAGDAADVAG
jgi:formylglycine-generating enzyme required for sulfatase activity